MLTKKCARCEKILPVVAFPRNKPSKDGLASYCRDCAYEKQIEWLNQHPDYHRSPKRKDYYRNYYKVRRQDPTYRLKQAARAWVLCAIQCGMIQRGPCVECGRSTQKMEAHHADYLKPLEVRWYCRRCHKRLHSGATYQKLDGQSLPAVVSFTR